MGDDLICDAHINIVQATLGTKIEVPTINGKVKLKIPAGTQTGTLFKLRRKGIPHLNSFGRGNQLVRVIVDIPTKLTPRQKELLKILAKEMKEKPTFKSPENI